MQITPLVLSVRAVSAAFARQLYVPIVSIVSGVLAAVLLFSIWLVFQSAWWWILLALVIFITLLFAFIAIIGRFAIVLLEPTQTKEQRSLVKSFAQDIQHTAEFAGTPKFILFFRLLKDMVSPSDNSLISEVSNTADNLRTKLKAIIRSFQ